MKIRKLSYNKGYAGEYSDYIINDTLPEMPICKAAATRVRISYGYGMFRPTEYAMYYIRSDSKGKDIVELKASLDQSGEPVATIEEFMKCMGLEVI